MKNSNVIICFLTLFFFNCVNNVNKELEIGVKEIVNKEIDLHDVKYIVVIPNEGCGGCISDASAFFKENNKIYKKNTLVIFTGIQDMKLFKLKIGEDYLSTNNVFIDENNFFMNTKYSSIYPQLIELNKTKILRFSLFDKTDFARNY